MIARPNLATYCLARGDESGRLVVSRIADGLVLWETIAHQGPISALVWSPDALCLASGGQDGMVCVWEVVSGELLHSFAHGEEIRRLLWSSHGMLASAGATIHLWSLADTRAIAA